MKGSMTLVASALAAAAITSSTTSHRDVTLNPCLDHQVKSVVKREKYAPKIDGLRFIETLITAHSFIIDEPHANYEWLPTHVASCNEFEPSNLT